MTRALPWMPIGRRLGEVGHRPAGGPSSPARVAGDGGGDRSAACSSSAPAAGHRASERDGVAHAVGSASCGDGGRVAEGGGRHHRRVSDALLPGAEWCPEPQSFVAGGSRLATLRDNVDSSVCRAQRGDSMGPSRDPDRIGRRRCAPSIWGQTCARQARRTQATAACGQLCARRTPRRCPWLRGQPGRAGARWRTPRAGFDGDQRVDLGGGHRRVAEQLLDHADVGAAVEQVGGERVPQRVRRDLGVHPGPLGRLAEHRPRALPGQPPAAGVEEHRGQPRPARGQLGPRRAPGRPRRPSRRRSRPARAAPCRPCRAAARCPASRSRSSTSSPTASEIRAPVP